VSTFLACRLTIPAAQAQDHASNQPQLRFKGRLIQYARRILRPYPGKDTAEVHDYHDTATPVPAASPAKRTPGYTSLGFPDPRRT